MWTCPKQRFFLIVKKKAGKKQVKPSLTGFECSLDGESNRTEGE